MLTGWGRLEQLETSAGGIEALSYPSREQDADDSVHGRVLLRRYSGSLLQPGDDPRDQTSRHDVKSHVDRLLRLRVGDARIKQVCAGGDKGERQNGIERNLEWPCYGRVPEAQHEHRNTGEKKEEPEHRRRE